MDTVTTLPQILNYWLLSSIQVFFSRSYTHYLPLLHQVRVSLPCVSCTLKIRYDRTHRNASLNASVEVRVSLDHVHLSHTCLTFPHCFIDVCILGIFFILLHAGVCILVQDREFLFPSPPFEPCQILPNFVAYHSYLPRWRVIA